METITLYKCDICGKQHTTEKDCKKCEQSHKSVVRITNADYDAFSEYPNRVEVQFADGAKMVFHRSLV